MHMHVWQLTAVFSCTHAHVHHKLKGLFCDECFQWGPASPQKRFQKSEFIELDLVGQTIAGFHESMHAVLMIDYHSQ